MKPGNRGQAIGAASSGVELDVVMAAIRIAMAQ
jgi:hypothetical protein